MDQNLKEIYKAAKDVRDAGGDYLEVRPTFPTEWRGDGWGNALSDVDAARTELEHAKLHLNSPTFRVIGMIERFDSLTEVPQKGFTKCRIGPLMTVIGATGDLWHCCVQRGQDFFKIGDVLTTGFKDAWRQAQKRKMADEIDISKCPRCRYTGFNQLIEKAFLADDMHANFV
jgi:radical SAM protein with 4Fe4S-binding SPASM domain